MFNENIKWYSHYCKQYESTKNTNKGATIQANQTVPRFISKGNEPGSKKHLYSPYSLQLNSQSQNLEKA